MPRLIFTILASTGFLTATCQEMQVNYSRRDIRAGWKNSLEFSFNRKFDSVHLHVTQGTVMREGKTILFTPDTPGKETLSATFYYKRKLVHSDSVSFNVIRPEVLSEKIPAFFPRLNLRIALVKRLIKN